jgi:hypothetical protein
MKCQIEPLLIIFHVQSDTFEIIIVTALLGRRSVS